jgi:hypothetical protein
MKLSQKEKGLLGQFSKKPLHGKLEFSVKRLFRDDYL